MNNLPFWLLFILSTICWSCKPTEKLVVKKTLTHKLAFYNVENLFDTIDDPTRADEDFTPAGELQWSEERYRVKLQKIDQVIAGMDFPAFLGLCEVENETVLSDLTKQEKTKKHNYQFVHYDSPDQRGIDVALLYKRSDFKVIRSQKIPVFIPEEVEANYTTRDILYVKGEYQKDHILHFFINHWPSRRGGVAESEAKRVLAANLLRTKVDSLFRINEKTKIIIMGDFNDETDNKSIAEVLQAKAQLSEETPLALVNLATPLDQQNQGSYQYRGEWNMLDQIIVSSALARTGSPIHVGPQQIYKPEWLLFQDPRDGPRPNRTYGGPNYYGGYSDHLPVFAQITLAK